MLDIGGIGPPGGGPLIGPYMGIPGPMGPPGPIGPPGPLGGVILGPIPGGPAHGKNLKTFACLFNPPCMGKKSPSWPLKGSPPGPIIGILMPGGPRGPGYRGPMGGKPGPPGPTFEETVSISR